MRSWGGIQCRRTLGVAASRRHGLPAKGALGTTAERAFSGTAGEWDGGRSGGSRKARCPPPAAVPVEWIEWVENGLPLRSSMLGKCRGPSRGRVEGAPSEPTSRPLLARLSHSIIGRKVGDRSQSDAPARAI